MNERHERPELKRAYSSYTNAPTPPPEQNDYLSQEMDRTDWKYMKTDATNMMIPNSYASVPPTANTPQPINVEETQISAHQREEANFDRMDEADQKVSTTLLSM